VVAPRSTLALSARRLKRLGQPLGFVFGPRPQDDQRGCCPEDASRRRGAAWSNSGRGPPDDPGVVRGVAPKRCGRGSRVLRSHQARRRPHDPRWIRVNSPVARRRRSRGGFDGWRDCSRRRELSRRGRVQPLGRRGRSVATMVRRRREHGARRHRVGHRQHRGGRRRRRATGAGKCRVEVVWVGGGAGDGASAGRGTAGVVSSSRTTAGRSSCGRALPAVRPDFQVRRVARGLLSAIRHCGTRVVVCDGDCH
jgi:hypothetical protein